MISPTQQSLFIPYRQGQLHVRFIPAKGMNKQFTPILMLHGAMSNGRVFYSDSGRGLGCYLAEQGFDVYVLDTAGRGKSTPLIDKYYDLGQGEVIREQLPLVQSFILQRHPLAAKVHWCAHSWGGVLMASSLIRFIDLQANVASFLTFGTKRTIKIKSLRKWLMVDVFWNRLAPLVATKQGFFDAYRYRFGMDNESHQSLSQSIDWVRGEWIDHDDHFNYAIAAKNTIWPITWFIAGKNDSVLGNPSDVQDMMSECGFQQAEYTLLAKEHGNLYDYGHADMLTHKQASDDHFIKVKNWYLAQAQ